MLDYPLPFFIATQPRSGFNLLMSLLNSTGEIGDSGEWLVNLPDDLPHDSEILSSVANYYKAATYRVNSRYWGMKLDMNHLRFAKRFFELTAVAPSSLKWIWLIRKNKLAQAISLIKAIRTGVWHISKDDKSELGKQETLPNHCIDMEELWTEINNRIEEDKIWSAYFAENRIEPHIIYYEDFIVSETWQQLVADIFDFLGVAYELPMQLSSNLVKLPHGKTILI